MAESTDVRVPTTGNVAKIATDAVTIGGENVVIQRVKTGFGADSEYADVSADNAMPVTHRRREEIAGLSFVQAITSLSYYQTSWVDVRDWKWLDFDVEVETNDAFTALLEFTDADAPNTTPPGANDIVRQLSQTIGGTGLGGPSNVLSFGIPAQMRWCRVKATDTTGGQTVKVVAYGQIVPPEGAMLPLAATITRDFRAPLTQSVERAFDPSNTFQARRYSGLVSTQSSTTTITASNSFTGSEWVDTTGFVGVSVFLKSNANTATDGVILQLSFDSGTTVHYSDTRTYDDAPNGVLFKFSIATPGVKVRVKVTAGASDMTGLVLKTFMLADETEDVSVRLGDSVTDGMVADLTKAQLVAEKDGGGYANVGATSSGYLKMAVSEHTVDTPIKAVNTSGSTYQRTINTGAATRVDNTLLTNRKSMRIRAHTANTANVYFGYTDAVDTSTGDELAPGEAVDLEIGTTINVWAATGTNGQKVSVNQIS